MRKTSPVFPPAPGFLPTDSWARLDLPFFFILKEGSSRFTTSTSQQIRILSANLFKVTNTFNSAWNQLMTIQKCITISYFIHFDLIPLSLVPFLVCWAEDISQGSWDLLWQALRIGTCIYIYIYHINVSNILCNLSKQPSFFMYPLSCIVIVTIVLLDRCSLKQMMHTTS